MYRALGAAVLAALVGIGGAAPARSADAPALPYGASQRGTAAEGARRTNNAGIALLEQYEYASAVEAFRRALALDPTLGAARANLALALHFAADDTAAEPEARAAAAALPAALEPRYLLGLIAKAAGRSDEAIEQFRAVLATDPEDVGANLGLGQSLAERRRFPEAIAALRSVVAVEPYNTTALFVLANVLTRSGDRDGGRATLERFRLVKERNEGNAFGLAYLEQGRYANAMGSSPPSGEAPDVGPKPSVRFVDATPPGIRAGGRPARGAAVGLALADLDGDGALDMVAVSDGTVRLYRNARGGFAPAAPLPRPGAGDGPALCAVAGDVDNDGHADLVVVRTSGVALLRGDGHGAFADATRAARLPRTSLRSAVVALFDTNHDGFLDIAVAGEGARGATASAAVLLLRNNGDGTFADATPASKLAAPREPVAVVPTDFDNRRDVDVLLVGAGGRPALAKNMRDGSFEDVCARVGLAGVVGAACVAAGDLNADGYVDFFLGGAACAFALSDGKGNFAMRPAPREASGLTAAQLVDYDNDGTLDLVGAGPDGLRVLRNDRGSWADVTRSVVSQTGSAGPAPRAPRRAPIRASAAALRCALSAGDLDGDGDTDVVWTTADGDVRVARNDGGNANASLRIELVAATSNRSAVSARVEVRADALTGRRETYAASPAPAPADVLVGLGAAGRADAVRVLWPLGILQAETAIPPPVVGTSLTRIVVTELDRKASW